MKQTKYFYSSFSLKSLTPAMQMTRMCGRYARITSCPGPNQWHCRVFNFKGNYCLKEEKKAVKFRNGFVHLNLFWQWDMCVVFYLSHVNFFSLLLFSLMDVIIFFLLKKYTTKDLSIRSASVWTFFTKFVAFAVKLIFFFCNFTPN